MNAEVRNGKAEVEAGGKSRRGRNPVDKEYRRLKRYLFLLMLQNVEEQKNNLICACPDC